MLRLVSKVAFPFQLFPATVAMMALVGTAPALAQAANPSWLRPGGVFLALAHDATSSVELDLDALGQLACRLPAEPNVVVPRGQVQARMGGGSEECRLVVGNGGNGGVPDSGPPTDLRLQVGQFVGDHGGCGTMVEVRPTQLSLWGDGRLDLPCGPKSFSIGLASGVAQPSSWLHLMAGDPQESTGWFVGQLAIEAEVRISETEHAIPPRSPLPLKLEISGRWTVLDPSTHPDLPSGHSTLVLFVERSGSLWGGKISCGQERARCGRLCFEAAAESLAGLNSGGVSQ